VAFTFIHTADIHLDSPLRSLALRDRELSDVIATATRKVFTNIVQLCIDEQVDALMIVGDLYDANQSSIKTALFLASELRRLHKAGIRVFIIRGNHDAGSKITNELVLPENVKTFGSRAEAIEIERAPHERRVFVHGISFSGTSADQSLLPKFKAPIDGAINIGLLHTSLNGAPGHDPYAPCSVAELQQNGFDYWGLGHIHKRSVYSGPCTIVMPGIPQGRDVGESGVKSVTLVRISSDRAIEIEELPTSLAQFERLTINVSHIADWAELARHLEQCLAEARAKVQTSHYVVRIEIIGKSSLYWQIRRDYDQLHSQLIDIARSLESCWIDKLEIMCDLPADTTAPSDDPITELRRLVDANVVPGDAFRASIETLAIDFRSQLPSECRTFLPVEPKAMREILNALTHEGIEDVLALLQSSDETEAH
jgi:DNA repair exonuclease SbcCD nuclease subunit